MCYCFSLIGGSNSISNRFVTIFLNFFFFNKQNMWTDYQCQERTSTTWNVANIITVAPFRIRSPTMPTCCILASEQPRKTQHSQALEGTMPLHTGKWQSKINSDRIHWSLMTSNTQIYIHCPSLPPSWCRAVGIYALLSAAKKGAPLPSPWSWKYWKSESHWGIWVSRTKEHPLTIKHGSKLLTPAQAVCSLYLLVRDSLHGSNDCVNDFPYSYTVWEKIFLK